MLTEQLLRRIDLRGLAETEQRRYVNRIRKILSVVAERFPHVNRPEQIRLKHMQYVRNVWLSEYTESPRTKTEYLRAIGVIVRALDRSTNWLGELGLLTSSTAGGRPTKVGVRRSRKFRTG